MFHFFIYGVKIYIFAKKVTTHATKGRYNTTKNTAVIIFPNAKINLGLNIVSKREDGYHNIETVFYPVKGLCDIIEYRESRTGETSLDMGGIKIDSTQDDNLVFKAYKLLAEEHKIPALDIMLRKNIPSGAGLGGGSADAAFMLTALNEEYGLGISEDDICRKAALLGSDCAFFTLNKPVCASGRGEIFSPVSLDLSGYKIVIVKSDDFVSTKEAYANCKPQSPAASIKDILKTPIEEWKNNLVNDFEKSVFTTHPEVKRIKERLYSEGALYASMSGSGASVFGIFSKETDENELFRRMKSQMPTYFVFCETLE